MAAWARISSKLRRAVEKRAGFLCEYCHLRQDLCPEPFEIDHIIPRAHGGPTRLNNLCLACPVCNNAKRSKVAGRDSETRRTVRLFHPRLQSWSDHFEWSDDFGTILGRSSIGRATVASLDMNHPRVVQIRLIWASLGLHPPEATLYG